VRSVLGKGTCVTLEIPFSVLPAVPRVVQERKDEGSREHPTLNVLVVDDQQANRVLLTQHLAYFGQVVASAENGEEAVRRWQDGNIDVIFTDCNMPVMNGYEMTRRIRELEQQRGLPRCTIIGFTANAQPEEKTKCLEAGMDDCMFKPVSLSALSALLMSLAADEPGPGAEDVPTQGATAQPNSIEGILRDLTGGDQAMMQSLLEEARSSYARDLAELKVQQEHFAPDAMSNLAHRIKGAARILQARRVIDACDRIERLCSEIPVDQATVLDQAAVVAGELEGLIRQVQDLSLDREVEQG